MSHFTPQQMQKDATKIAEFFIGSTAITVQAVAVTLAVWIYW